MSLLLFIIVSGWQKQRGKNWSVGCNIMCGALALKIAISLKNGEQKNLKIINTHSFLTILVVSLLRFNNSEWEVEVAGAKIGPWAVISGVARWH